MGNIKALLVSVSKYPVLQLVELPLCKNDLFAVIIIFKILLKNKEFRLMMKEIEYEIELLDGRIDSISINKILDRMGFPKNYIELIEK